MVVLQLVSVQIALCWWKNWTFPNVPPLQTRTRTSIPGAVVIKDCLWQRSKTLPMPLLQTQFVLVSLFARMNWRIGVQLNGIGLRSQGFTDDFESESCHATETGLTIFKTRIHEHEYTKIVWQHEIGAQMALHDSATAWESTYSPYPRAAADKLALSLLLATLPNLTTDQRLHLQLKNKIYELSGLKLRSDSFYWILPIQLWFFYLVIHSIGLKWKGSHNTNNEDKEWLKIVTLINFMPAWGYHDVRNRTVWYCRGRKVAAVMALSIYDIQQLVVFQDPAWLRKLLAVSIPVRPRLIGHGWGSDFRGYWMTISMRWFYSSWRLLCGQERLQVFCL